MVVEELPSELLVVTPPSEFPLLVELAAGVVDEEPSALVVVCDPFELDVVDVPFVLVVVFEPLGF